MVIKQEPRVFVGKGIGNKIFREVEVGVTKIYGPS